MTRDQIKAAIRRGDRTPGVAYDLFESCYLEVMKTDHPNFTIKTLVESRDSGRNFERDGVLPDGVHARVATLFEASDHPVSTLKSDTMVNPPQPLQYPDFGSALRGAVAAYLKNPLPAPKPKPKPVMTLSESRSQAEFRRRFPEATDADYAYALLADRL